MTLLAEPPTVVRCRHCHRPLRDPDSVRRRAGPCCDPPDHKPRRARARTQQGPDLLDQLKEKPMPDPAEALAQRLIEGPLADVIAEAGADTDGTVPDIKRRLVAEMRAALPEPIGYIVVDVEYGYPHGEKHLTAEGATEEAERMSERYGIDYRPMALLPLRELNQDAPERCGDTSPAPERPSPVESDE